MSTRRLKILEARLWKVLLQVVRVAIKPRVINASGCRTECCDRHLVLNHYQICSNFCSSSCLALMCTHPYTSATLTAGLYEVYQVGRQPFVINNEHTCFGNNKNANWTTGTLKELRTRIIYTKWRSEGDIWIDLNATLANLNGMSRRRLLNTRSGFFNLAHLNLIPIP